ncbi:NapC/NirT family cytochrome c [Neobacillus mesonae]|uniref:Nitrate reductase n=1 Tax=Neobacillus mesonae TaxID=1193713 RepID=A0A3T0I2T5_9BACI|nr:NapC/NirT family cytochrome c [Neobacillus mesonae]AZU63668.1 nitrate reductase [Neobacillus mesonae]
MFKKLFKMPKKWLLVLALIVGVFLSFSTVKSMDYLDSPGFCQNCHTMQSQYASFMDSTHAELQCNDCHLPHKSEAGKLFFKGRAGMTHIYYNTLGKNQIPDVIHATERTKGIMNDNCISCHKSTLTNVSHDAKDSCTSCHTTVPHGKGFKDDHYNKPPVSGELLKNKGGF